MARPTLRKSGPLTATERQQRWRAKVRKQKEQAPKLAKQQAKWQHRAERESRLAEKTLAVSAALGTKLYNVIYADPPWRFEPYSRDTGMDRAADNHYPTEQTEKIKAMPVAAAAAPDCVLFLWATVPMLPQAIEVAAAWGFEYKSTLFWDKILQGTGYWSRDRVEVLLIATRGHVPAPAPGDQPEQLRAERRGEHSVKPESFAQDIARLRETLVKNLTNVCRRPREGWDSWGNEV